MIRARKRCRLSVIDTSTILNKGNKDQSRRNIFRLDSAVWNRIFTFADVDIYSFLHTMGCVCTFFYRLRECRLAWPCYIKSATTISNDVYNCMHQKNMRLSSVHNVSPEDMQKLTKFNIMELGCKNWKDSDLVYLQGPILMRYTYKATSWLEIRFVYCVVYII